MSCLVSRSISNLREVYALARRQKFYCLVKLCELVDVHIIFFPTNCPQIGWVIHKERFDNVIIDSVSVSISEHYSFDGTVGARE